MVAFSIATLNVDGIRDDGKRARFFEYLNTEWGALASGILEAIGPGV